MMENRLHELVSGTYKGNKMIEWKKYKLEDLCDELSDGLHKAPKFEENGEYIFVNAKNLSNGKIIDIDKTKHSSYEEFLKYKIDLNDQTLLYSIDGTIGNLAKYNNEKCILGKGACYLIIKESVSRDFVYYQLQSPDFKNYIKFYTTGSTIGHISLKTMRNYSFPLPPLETQKKIAAILSSLDDKIELNNKISENLEQQVMALFKHYFGSSSQEKDFEIKELGSVTTNLRDRINDNNTPVFSAVNTGNLQRSDDYFSKQVYSKDISKYILVKIGDFAYNPARINIGSIGINDFDYNGCVSPVYVAFSVDKDYRSFFKYYFKSNTFKEETKLRASGSVRQSLNYSDFAKIQIKYPPRELAKKFEEFHTNIEQAKKKIKKENEVLVSIRDTLLPKLMNGEIEV